MTGRAGESAPAATGGAEATGSLADELFDLICYLVVSARNCVEETKLYGPLRLAEAASRIIALMAQRGMSTEFLCSLRERIESSKYTVMTDVPAFVRMLDDAAAAVGAELARRD